MLELHAFGPVDLRADESGLGSVVTQPKRVALLLYLVLARPHGLQRRDTLLTVFWPELDEAHARSALSQSLSFLRRGLPGSLLRVRGGEEVGVDPGGIRCDVIEFERAVEERRWADAVELYRGELLAGFHGPDSAGFEAWLDVERERLRELAAGAAWSLAHERIEGGELVLAERAGQRALRLVPTDESAARDFIRALAAAGDRAAALRFYDKFAGVLAEELGVEPAPETSAVMEAIRAGMIGPAPESGRDESSAPALSPEDRNPGDVDQAPSGGKGAATSGDARPAAIRRTRPFRWRAVAAAGLVVALAGVVLLLVARRPTTVASRVAVLPFENRTGEPEWDPLGIVAADWITGGVARMDALQAVPTPTVAAALGDAAGERDRPRWIARRTGAGLVVRGYVVSAGDSLELRAELVDPVGGKVLDVFDPVRSARSDPTRALGPLRRQIMGRVGIRLETRLAGMLTITRAAPPTYDAYKAYMAGVDLFSARRFREAIGALDRAWAADSGFVAPGIWLASVYWNLRWPGREARILRRLRARRASLTPFEEGSLDVLEAQLRGDNAAVYRISRDGYRRMPSAEGRYMTATFALHTNRLREAVRTLRSEPQDGPTRSMWLSYHAHLTDALHWLREYRQERAAAREAHARFPDRPEPVFWQARALIGLGRVDEALSFVDEALALPAPGWSPGEIRRAAAKELRVHGYDQSAQQVLRQAMEWYRANAADGDYRYGIAMALQSLGHPDSAVAILRQLAAEQPESVDLQGSLALALAAAGRVEEARRVDQRLVAWQDPYVRGRDLYWRAAIAAHLDDKEQAVELLRGAVARGVSYASLYEDEALQPLWDFPGFGKFMEPMAH